MNQQHRTTGFILSRGFTLLEMIVVMAVLGIVLTTASILLCLILDLSLHHKTEVIARNGQERLLTAFRHDVKEFGRPEIVISSLVTGSPQEVQDVTLTKENDQVLLRWKTTNGELVYHLSISERGTISMNRELSAEGKIPVREMFALAEGVRIDFYEGGETYQHLVALSLWKNPIRSFKINAADLNPFTGAMAPDVSKQIDPRYATNWQIALARFSE